MASSACKSPTERFKHTIPLGTKVSFGVTGHSIVYTISDYQTLLGPCPPDCNHDHDCYTEPYVHVTQTTGMAFPLSKLDVIFDQPRFGRKPTQAELTPVIEGGKDEA
jgi:hypothetical protein